MRDIVEKPISNIRRVKVFHDAGFASSEVLVILLCLDLVDDRYYLDINADDICEILGINKRTAYYALKKMKDCGLTKVGHHYYLKTFIDNMIPEET